MLSYFLSLLETDADKELFAEIYLQTHVEIEKMVRSKIGNHHDAEDAIQKTYTKAMDAFHKLLPIPSEERIHWLRRVAYNVVMDHFREQDETHREKERIVAEQWERTATRAGDIENRDQLAQFLEEMPVIYREALELKYFEDCSGEEIARRLHISVTNANTRLSRGRSILREIVERDGFCW